MANITIYQALLGEIEPYSPSGLTLKKALIDQGLSGDDEYTADHKRNVIIAAINVLKKMIVLTSDQVGKDAQGFSVSYLKDRIRDLCNKAGLDSSDYIDVPTITDGSNFW